MCFGLIHSLVRPTRMWNTLVDFQSASLSIEIRPRHIAFSDTRYPWAYPRPAKNMCNTENTIVISKLCNIVYIALSNFLSGFFWNQNPITTRDVDTWARTPQRPVHRILSRDFWRVLIGVVEAPRTFRNFRGGECGWCKRSLSAWICAR